MSKIRPLDSKVVFDFVLGLEPFLELVAPATSASFEKIVSPFTDEFRKRNLRSRGVLDGARVRE